MSKTFLELVDEHETEIDNENFRNFILDVVKERGAEGINEAKKVFKEEGCLETLEKEIYKLLKQLAGVEEVL